VLDHLRYPHQYPTLFAPVSSQLVSVLANRIVQDLDQRAASGKRYLEFIRVAAMSAGIYVLPNVEKLRLVGRSVTKSRRKLLHPTDNSLDARLPGCHQNQASESNLGIKLQNQS
jgi:hypothetical protein